MEEIKCEVLNEFQPLKVCRSCLNQCDHTYPIKGKVLYQDLEIHDMLTYCTGSEIALDEDLPSVVCMECSKMIMTAYKFLCQFQECQEKLRLKTANNLTEDFKIIICPESPLNDQISDDNDNIESYAKGEESDAADDFAKDKDMSESDSNTETKKTKRKRKKAVKEKLFTIGYSELSTTNDDKNSTVELFEVKQNKHATDKSVKFFLVPTCPICEKTFAFQDLIKHLKSNHLDKKYYCSMCIRRRVFTSERFVQHLLQKHVCYCEICQTMFPSPFTLYYHTRTTHTESKHSYKCDECDKVFPLKARLTDHKNNKHAVGENHLCNLCGKAFRRYRSYYMHKKRHENPEVDERFKCELCDRKFMFSFGLKRHMDLHSEAKNFLCIKCGKTFRTYDTYHYHVKTHDNTRNHICSLCGQTFLQAVHLKDHMEKHSGLKSYSCKICNKDYSCASSLRKHKRKYHSGNNEEQG